MKKIYILVLVLFWIQANAQKSTLIYDDNAQLRQVGFFNAIKVSSGIDLYLTQSNETQVAISASDNDIRNKIQTVIEGTTLVIKLEYAKGWGSWNKWGNHKMKAYVSVKDLNALTGSGASTIRLVSAISSPKLQIKLSGASDLKGEIEAGVLNVNLSGASEMNGHVNAGSLLLDASGASDCELSGAADDMSLELSGASDAKLYNLFVKGAVVNASGASSAHINVSSLLKATASGSSDINYKGSAVLKQSNSNGSSSIRHRD